MLLVLIRRDWMPGCGRWAFRPRTPAISRNSLRIAIILGPSMRTAVTWPRTSSSTPAGGDDIVVIIFPWWPTGGTFLDDGLAQTGAQVSSAPRARDQRVRDAHFTQDRRAKARPEVHHHPALEDQTEPAAQVAAPHFSPSTKKRSRTASPCRTRPPAHPPPTRATPLMTCVHTAHYCTYTATRQHCCCLLNSPTDRTPQRPPPLPALGDARLSLGPPLAVEQAHIAPALGGEPSHPLEHRAA